MNKGRIQLSGNYSSMAVTQSNKFDTTRRGLLQMK